MLLDSWLSCLFRSRVVPGRRQRHSHRLPAVERLEDRTLLSAIHVDAASVAVGADGSVEHPFPTIQAGLDAAAPGDQVEVAGGRYYENIVMKTGVSVLGSGADGTFLVGRPDSAGTVLFDDVEQAGFSGFTIETSDPTNTRSRAVVFAGSTEETAVLERSVITESMYGVLVRSPARPSIVNNTFDGRGDKQGIYVGNRPTDPTIVNNVIVGYAEAGIHVVAGTTAPVPIIEHNDLYRNRADYFNYPDLTGRRGNVSVDPGFVDPAHADYSLEDLSPLIDIGHPLHGVDPDGTPRDLGAVPTDQVTTQSTTWTFEIDEEFDVPWELFNVTTAGTIDIEVDWTGDTDILKAVLTGRRRPALPDPTKPYAVNKGTSPLSLSHVVTATDLEHGPGFRILLDDGGNPAHDAVGTITVTVPFNETTDALFQSEKISLRSGDLWPSQELQDEFLIDLAASPVDGQHAMISFSETPDCLEVKDLQHNGIFRQSYLPGRHVFGWLLPELDLEPEEIGGLVNWITPLEPEDKVDPDLLMGNYSAFDLDGSDPTNGNYIVNADGSLVVTVIFAEDTDILEAGGILAATTNGAVQISRSGWLAGIDPENLIDVAEYDVVEWVGGPPVPHLETNDTTRMTLGVDEDANSNGVLDAGEDRDADAVLDSVQQPTINAGANSIAYAGLTGNGVNVGIHESSAIDVAHNDLTVVGAVNASASIGSHATHVAGIVAGTGPSSNTVDMDLDGNNDAAFQYRGMAPQAGLIDMGQFNFSVTGGVFNFAVLPPADLETAINNFSLDLSNHSHVFTTNGRYDVNSVNVDEAISGEAGVPRRPQVFAAGNNGGQAVQNAGNAALSNHGDQESFFSVTNETKNSIVVGNWVANLGRLNFSSSKGPTYDGRIKPDVIAPGSDIYSTEYNEDLNGNGLLDVGEDFNGDGVLDVGPYVFKTGTSMASPAVAGVIALMLEGWQNTYSTPLSTTIDDSPPLPATLKAILVQTSDDVVLINEDADGDFGLDPGEDLNGDGLLASGAMGWTEDTNFNGVLDPGEDTTVNGGPNGVLDATNRLVDVDVDSDSNPANGSTSGFIAATVGPDYVTGWGLVNAEAAVDLVLDSRDEHGFPVPNRMVQDSLQHLEVIEYDFAVDTDMINAGDDVRVTLAWDDVAAAIQNTVSAATLVNDLDLELIDPVGNSFYPWQLGQVLRDAAGNVVAPAAQTPGTNIKVDLPFRDEVEPGWDAPTANASDNVSITLTSTPAVSNDYIPANAMMGNGVWVASKGRDHINNVEVVDIDNANLTVGHWTLQVSGFDVQDGPQDFAVVGQPHPDLADLVAYSDVKVTIGSLGEDLDLEFTVENVGDDVSESAAQYEILLSSDFELGSDVILYTSANNAIPVLNPGDTHSESTTVQINAADVTNLLGAGADFDDMIENDVFLLVRVDSNNTVNSHGDVLENNETNIAFLQMAREADVVLVMDRSGSMTSTVTNVSSGTPTKLDVLQNSASLFLDLMRLDEGDQIAEVAFNLVSDVVFEDGAVVGDTLVEIETGNLAAAQTAVDDLIAGGATNMTDALLDAYDLLVDLDTNGQVIPSDRQKVIVLFSDGVPTAGLPMDPRDLSTAAGDSVDLDSFEDAGIRIYSVGFGTDGEGGIAGIDIDLLEDLANVGDGGFYHVTGSVLDLDKFFVNAVAGAIDSEVIIDPVGSIGGQSEIDASEILVNSQDSRVTFVLTWDNQAEDLDLSVRTPSGVVIGDGNAAAFGDRVSLTASDTYRLLEVHMPLSIGGEEEHAGSWTMMVNNDGTNTVAYSVSAITQSTIRMDTDFDNPPPGQDYFVPGDSIPLTVKLTGDDRVPLGYSNVSMTPIVPIANLNNMLAGAMISPADLAAIPLESNGEVLSEMQRMIMAYEQLHGTIDEMVMELDPVYLEPDHDHDGQQEWAGEWSGTFDSTEVPGPYTFVIRAEGCSDLCEPFSREVTRTVYVYERFDPQLTGIDVVMPDDDSVVVTVTPTNSDGTVYSPGLDDGDLLVSWGDGFSGSGDVTNNLDGSYSVTLDIDDGETIGDLEVWVEGTLLQMDKVDFQAQVSGIEGRPAKFFGEDAALNVAILGQANGITELALKPVDNPAWAAPTRELVGNGGLWQLSGGIVRIPATPSQGGSSVAATIPADLPVGEYTVQLKTTSGLGPVDKTSTYRVIGRGGELPERVQVVDDRLEEFETGRMTEIADWRAMGERLVREVLELPIGKHLTESLRLEAAEVVLETIDQVDFLRCDSDSTATQPGMVNVIYGGVTYHSPCARPGLEMAKFKPLVRAINLAHIDARFMDEQATTTATGDEIDVTLGSGVSLRIGKVSSEGESRVVVSEGDQDVPENLRSRTHVVYDITTTADFDQGDGVEINLTYEEGDFESEDKVRLFHKEDGEWVDRTTSIDTVNNVVTGLTSSLSPFMMTETPDLSVADASVIEGDTGTAGLEFTATLSEASFVDVSVDYAVTAGTATDAVDFVSTSGVLTILAGNLSGTISVDVNGDVQMEGIETLLVALSNAEAATIVDGTATGTILDDEHSVTFNDSTGAFELVLDAGGSSSITADGGLVSLQINGNPDPALAAISADQVVTIVVTGSAESDTVDLSGASADNGFDLLNAVTVNAGDGDDTVTGSPVANKLNGSGGNDHLTGGAGDDTINGGGGEDNLSGGEGDDAVRGQGSSLDTVSGGPGDDTIDGGSGYDYLFESADVNFTVTDNALTGLGSDTLTEIQVAQLFGGSSDNQIDATGFSGRAFFSGAGGNDTILGGANHDRMFGGAGRDVILGGEGNDVLRGQGGNLDSLVGGPGDDKLNGGIGNDDLSGGEGDDQLTGESGNDILRGGAGDDRVFEKADVDIVLLDTSMTGGLGTDVLSGIESAYLKGGNSDNTFDAGGFSGPVTMIGSGGDDQLIGGASGDVLVGRSGNDSIRGGPGDDTISGLRGEDMLAGGDGNDRIDGGADADALTGQDGDDILYGRNGNDSLVGGEGSDTILGADGDDIAIGDDGKNNTAASDDDTIDGGSGEDTVRGGGGSDTISDDLEEIDESFELLADWVDSV